MIYVLAFDCFIGYPLYSLLIRGFYVEASNTPITGDIAHNQIGCDVLVHEVSRL